MSSTASVYSALAFNGFIFGILTITFEFLRTREVDIYAPRTRGKNPTAPKPQIGFGKFITFVMMKYYYWLDWMVT